MDTDPKTYSDQIERPNPMNYAHAHNFAKPYINHPRNEIGNNPSSYQFNKYNRYNNTKELQPELVNRKKRNEIAHQEKNKTRIQAQTQAQDQAQTQVQAPTPNLPQPITIPKLDIFLVSINSTLEKITSCIEECIENNNFTYVTIFIKKSTELTDKKNELEAISEEKNKAFQAENWMQCGIYKKSIDDNIIKCMNIIESIDNIKQSITKSFKPIDEQEFFTCVEILKREQADLVSEEKYFEANNAKTMIEQLESLKQNIIDYQLQIDIYKLNKLWDKCMECQNLSNKCIIECNTILKNIMKNENEKNEMIKYIKILKNDESSAVAQEDFFTANKIQSQIKEILSKLASVQLFKTYTGMHGPGPSLGPSLGLSPGPTLTHSPNINITCDFEKFKEGVNNMIKKKYIETEETLELHKSISDLVHDIVLQKDSNPFTHLFNKHLWTANPSQNELKYHPDGYHFTIDLSCECKKYIEIQQYFHTIHRSFKGKMDLDDMVLLSKESLTTVLKSCTVKKLKKI